MNYRAAFIKTFFDNMILPYIAKEGMEIIPGNWYVINTKFGEDIGLATSIVKEIPKERFHIKKPVVEHVNDADIDDIEIDDTSILEKKNEHIPLEIDSKQIENFQIIKEATQDELSQWQSFRAEELKAFESAKKEIKDLNLEMKLINVHFLYQRKKIIFNFTADNRIDFRQLVKRLAGIFKTRIEMRQIGVRDAAKILGGYGVCGVMNCCLKSNCHINSIYLKMAKDQGFVVNSSKLTGSCGRLMCCLAYEIDYYSEERKKYPDVGSLILDGQKNYSVVSLNIIKEEVYIADENHHQKKYPLEMLKFQRKDISGTSVYRINNTDEALKTNDNLNSSSTNLNVMNKSR